MNTPKFKEYVPGLIRVITLGIGSYFLADHIPYLNGIILGLLVGLLIGNLLPSSPIRNPGIVFASGTGLEIAIVFLAFSINYKSFGELGWSGILWLLLTLTLVLWFSRYLSKKMNCPGTSGYLIAFGTAICGSSAIAALAPQIKGSKDDTALSMAVVNLLGTAFMLVFPALFALLALPEAVSAFLTGGSLHAVGNVAGAGYSMGESIGNAAVTVKLARVAMLSPALFFMVFLLRKRDGGAARAPVKMPWYILAFLAITLVNSFVKLPSGFVDSMNTTGEVLLTLAMTAMGLKIKIKNLLQSGKKGIYFGLVIFGVQLFLLSIGAWLIV